ncbi:hypothetical protein B0H34DRAFT_679492 [Crassisporium funariophilum]|nr:hypothetical protein B0H34DRAFT_679492 [Crassisporium funariophilum]
MYLTPQLSHPRPPERQHHPKLSNGIITSASRKSAFQKAKAKRDKEAKKKKITSIFTFLKPKPKPILSTIHHSKPIHSQRLPLTGSTIIPTQSTAFPTPLAAALASISDPPPRSSGLLAKLQHLIENLPETIPEGTQDDKLAYFAGDPVDFDNPSLNADELWEESLNSHLKSVFGCGAEDDIKNLIRRGSYGLDGLANFVKYFVATRGINEALFEGKLLHLMNELEEIITDSQIWPTRIVPLVVNNSVAISNPLSTPKPSENAPVEIINVDSNELASKKKSRIKPAKVATHTCKGYVLIFPDGKSPHTCYPFALHDTLILPWDYTMRNSTMTLFANCCCGKLEGTLESCHACLSLAKDAILERIKEQIKSGVHQNATFAYHGFSGLHDLLDKKTAQIKFHRFQGLNQAKKLLSKATALSHQKQLIMAIASGKVNRIDRLLSIGLWQKRGIRRLLSLYFAAADGVYSPKSFTEEETIKSLLAWRLGGNCIAEINHHSRDDASLTYLRSHSDVPLLVPSPAQPTTLQVQKNVEASLDGILEEIHSCTKGKVLHTVVMFNELATEKRIRWDPKTNYFLGVCREHAHKISMEFVNEGDMEGLFRLIDDGKVHHAKEATIGALGILCKDNRIYPGRPVLVSGDCKIETGEEHVKVVQTVLDGVNSTQEKTKLCITSISSNAHLALVLYRMAGKDFIPTNLYIDVMLMIKNALFCVAKAKVDDPEGEFWIILLGTDRLEELFGILRTMVGNNANLDLYQLLGRIAGTTEVSNILAKYPHWDRSPRRLKIPSLSRDTKEIPDRADHIKPALWRGNVRVNNISLQTSWNRGQNIIEQDSEVIKSVLHELDNSEDVDMLSPFGILLVDAPLAEDDVDESLEFLPPFALGEDPAKNKGIQTDLDTNMRLEVETALNELITTPKSAESCKFNRDTPFVVQKRPRLVPWHNLVKIANAMVPGQRII